MPRKCAAFGSSDNYAGEPFSKLVSFPNHVNERKTMDQSNAERTNERTSLASKNKIWVYASHFDCD